MGAVRLELTKPEGEGFTVPCNCHYATPPKGREERLLAKGLEPSTVRLQGGCSTIELHQHKKLSLITNGVVYDQLFCSFT